MIKLSKYSEYDEDRLLQLIKTTTKFEILAKEVEDIIFKDTVLNRIINSIPKKKENLVENLILTDFKNIKDVKKQLDCVSYVFTDDWDKYKKQYNEFSKKKINIELLKAQNNKTCPYCNENYITNRAENTSHQLDHFYSKSKYPIFALSIYNLIPSCYACNHTKGDQTITVSPFDDDYDFDDITMTYIPKNEDFLYNEDSFDICFICSQQENDEKFKTNRKVLGLDAAYDNHKDYLLELMRKGEIYNEETIQSLLSEYPQLFSSKEEVLQTIYANYIEISKLNQRPLSKLTRDYLKEIGILK